MFAQNLDGAHPTPEAPLRTLTAPWTRRRARCRVGTLRACRRHCRGRTACAPLATACSDSASLPAAAPAANTRAAWWWWPSVRGADALAPITYAQTIRLPGHDSRGVNVRMYTGKELGLAPAQQQAVGAAQSRERRCTPSPLPPLPPSPRPRAPRPRAPPYSTAPARALSRRARRPRRPPRHSWPRSSASDCANVRGGTNTRITFSSLALAYMKRSGACGC